MLHDRLILGLDTTAKECSAILVQGNELLAERHESPTIGLAERLFPMLHEILLNTDKKWADLDKIVVVTGPGNHTGARLAISAGRGLSLSLDVPCIGITAFEAMAFEAKSPSLVIIEATNGFAHTQMLPSKETTFEKLSNITPPPKKTVVIGAECAKNWAHSKGYKWNKPQYSSALAAVKLAEDDNSLSELPVPYSNNSSSTYH